MSNISFKIAVRAFLKSKWYNFLNIAGLAFSLSGFILVMLYIDNETSYDTWNKNIEHIYLVERELPGEASPYTPRKLSEEIKAQCPEVLESGRINTFLWEIPFYSESGMFLIKKWIGADYSIAKIFNIKPKGFNLDPTSITPTVLLSKQTAGVLFPNYPNVQNRTVNILSKSGNPMLISGIADDAPGNTNLTYDCIGFSKDISQGKDQSYANQIYQTYLLVKPGTDINLLTKKIDRIYKEGALTDTSVIARQAANLQSSSIYLDPLKNLHLKPHFGSNVNYQIVVSLVVLAIIILILACVNFTSLYISQAHKRSKEVGIKKVNGVIPARIIVQFLTEIFIQCFISMVLALGIVSILLPFFNELLRVNLSLADINIRIIGQIGFALIILTFLAGTYPALVMARFKPISVLRGTHFSSGKGFLWIRSSLTVFQFTFAMIFIITLLVINKQVHYMQTEDRGFSAKQVVYIDNLTIYNKPQDFKLIRERIKGIPGIKNVTVATNIPGGIMPKSNEFLIEANTVELNTIGVDYEYFETLNIQFKEGRAFSPEFKNDVANAVINETAARMMNVKSPLGKTLQACNVNYKIIGIIKDVKDYGYEQAVKPTIYVMNNACTMSKTQIMFSAHSAQIPAILSLLKSQWSDINKFDGENFNYHFLDELYGKLFIKQQQLQSVLFYFSVLAILIASLGLFSSAAYSMNLRIKEIGIRKVLGATKQNLVISLNKPFIYMILIANFLAWPISLLILNKWLQTFAYRIHLSVNPFLVALIISLCLVGITVFLQAIKAALINPVKSLRRE